MRLYADNLQEFIWGHKIFYTVDGNGYQLGNIITLYDDKQECAFEICTILNINGRTVLGIRKE